MFSPLFERLVPSAALLFTRAFFLCFPQHSLRFVDFSRSLRSSAVLSQKFVSILTLTEQQIADADQLEPSFEHLLRDAKVDSGLFLALRHCEISDRETFEGLDDSAEGPKSLAKDMGIDLESGGMPHRREFSRLSTAWKKRLYNVSTVNPLPCFPKIGQVLSSNSKRNLAQTYRTRNCLHSTVTKNFKKGCRQGCYARSHSSK